VTFRLTGLSPGTLYFVAVTAVNTSGDESACTPLGSAVARLEFAVSPTGTVNFGSVNVGNFADQTFTVSNTSGGAVSGSVSTSAPFRIVSGSPFNLVGLGATQAVTMRFTPTRSATVMANVKFAADGATISRIVTGIGTDTTLPTVTIISPTSNPIYSTGSPLLTLMGTASDNGELTQVTWTNSRGGSGTASGTTSWTASGIVLRSGTNVLTVTAQDTAGNTAAVVLAVTLTGPLTFNDDPLVAQSTPILAMHIMELRAAIDNVRLGRGLAIFDWTDPTLSPGSSSVSVVHLTELRTALNEAYQAVGSPLPIYTDPTVVAAVTTIKAIHLTELRTAVREFLAIMTP
jgi:hypothetical protein